MSLEGVVFGLDLINGIITFSGESGFAWREIRCEMIPTFKLIH